MANHREQLEYRGFIDGTSKGTKTQGTAVLARHMLARKAVFASLVAFIVAAALTVLVVLCPVLALEVRAEAPSKTIVRVGYVETKNFTEGAHDQTEGAGEQVAKRGLGYEYLQKVSYYTNWEYEYVYGDWDTILQMLYDGEVDVMAGVSKTEERENKLYFPDYPMGSENYYIYVYADSPLAGLSVGELDGHTVSVNRNSIMEEMLYEWNDGGAHHMTIQTYGGSEIRYKAFQSGISDATVETDNVVVPEDMMVPVTRIGSSDYYLAVTRNRSDILRDLNNALNKIESTDPKFTKHLADQYFSDMAVSAQLQADERRWLRENPTIRVGYLDNYLPFSGTDEDGKATGIVTDVTKEITSQLGITAQVRLTYRGYDNAESLLEALQTGSVDVIFPEINDVAKAEGDNVFLTSPVIETAMSLVFKGEYTDDSTNRMAVKRGNAIQEAYTKEHYPNAQIVYVDSNDEALSMIQKGRIDSVIINEFRKDGYLNHTIYRDLNTVTLPDGSSRCYGVKSGNNELLSILNRGITNLPTNFAIRATYSYTGRLAQYTLQDMVLNHAYLVFGTLAAIIAAISTGVAHYYASKHRQKILDRMAHKDSMTGLLNRRSYDEFMDRVGEHIAEPGTMILAMDLNGLKHTNDTMGHEAGDELIEGAADVMKRVLGPHGKVYRIGGDEFVAILEMQYEHHDRVLHQLRREFADWKGKRVTSLSVALGSRISDEDSGKNLLQMGILADQRLYDEKEEYYKVTGRDRRRY